MNFIIGKIYDPLTAELTYFYEVANARSFSRAAKKLSMSQPSLSLAIKRIERTVGASLFVRHKQGVTLTPAGKKILQQVKQLLQHWDNARLEAVSSHQEIHGEVTLGCHSTVALFLHNILSDLFETHPELSVHLTHSFSQQTTEHVINSTLDIGIVTNPIKHPDLIIRKLNDSEMTFWQGKGRRKIQSIDSDRPVIICDPNIPQTAILLKKWKTQNLKHSRIIKTNCLEVVANLTANNCGIGILPSCFIHSIYPKQIQRIANAPSTFDEIFLIYRTESRQVKAIHTVIEALKNYMSNMPH